MFFMALLARRCCFPQSELKVVSVGKNSEDQENSETTKEYCSQENNRKEF